MIGFSTLNITDVLGILTSRSQILQSRLVGKIFKVYDFTHYKFKIKNFSFN